MSAKVPRVLKVSAPVAWFVSCLLFTGCSTGDPKGPAGADGQSGSAAGDGTVPVSEVDARAVTNALGRAPSERLVRGAELYQTQGCWKCHGEDGAGGSGPSLHGLDQRGRVEVLAAISERMPPNDPGACNDACAETLTDFVREVFAEAQTACTTIRPAPRVLRLLNRREYVRTVASLFSSGAGTGEKCGEHTFRYTPPMAADAVLLAGDFTDWRMGAVAMQKSADGSYAVTVTLAPGRHEYKFVLVRGGQDSWVSDPANPQTGSQGNSVLDITCAGEGEDLDTAQILAVLRGERLSDGLLFDTSLLSDVDEGAVEAYLDAATKIADAVDLRKIASCDLRANLSCASEVAGTFGRRAFRRALSEAEVARYASLVTEAADPSRGLHTMVVAFLSSPGFLYRTEVGEPVGDGVYELTALELASALSYGLTGTMPDDRLLQKAESGELKQPEVLESEAKRLLETELGKETWTEFVVQWLGVQRVGELTRDPGLYPEVNAALAADMLTETRAFIANVLYESSGTLEELLSAPYGFPSGRLAKHYGLTNAASLATRTDYAGTGRVGILGQASVLATYANPDATSPTKRGLFVRRNLMCQQFGTPPANAGVLTAVGPDLTTRERFAVHTESAACASCHVHIDPVGFVFEQFGAAGEFRERDHGRPVDTQGKLTGVSRLADGSEQPMSSIEELASALSDAPATHACAARQAYRFAHGVIESPLRTCATRFVLQQYRAANGRLMEIPLAVVRSVDFRFRY